MSVRNVEDIWAGFTDEDFRAIDDKGNWSSDTSPSTSPVQPKIPCQNRRRGNANVVQRVTKKKGLEIKCWNAAKRTVISVPTASTSKSTSDVARRKGRKISESPLQRYRYGRLWVTHIVQQAWCELQVHYTFEPPRADLQKEAIAEPAQVTVGTSIHLARELAVHDIVQVKVTSKEDSFAVKLMNLFDAVQNFMVKGKTTCREIPIFGTPFDMDVFVIGNIDEMRCAQDTLSLKIVELKTRKTNCLPTEAQEMSHRLQMMLYKRLFDDLVSGRVSKAAVSKHMRLNLNRTLSKDVLNHFGNKKLNTLSKLMDALSEMLQAAPFVSDLMLEYVFQKDGSAIGDVTVHYDEQWLRNKLMHAFGYWKGERPAAGVDLEDCWKCGWCPYVDACKWKANLDKKMASLAVTEAEHLPGDKSVVSDSTEEGEGGPGGDKSVVSDSTEEAGPGGDRSLDMFDADIGDVQIVEQSAVEVVVIEI